MREYLLILTVVLLLVSGTQVSVLGQTQVFSYATSEETTEDAADTNVLDSPESGLQDFDPAFGSEQPLQDLGKGTGFVGDRPDGEFIGGGVRPDGEVDLRPPSPDRVSPRGRPRWEDWRRARDRRARRNLIRVRTSLRVAFDYPRPANGYVSESLTEQLVRTNLVQGNSSLEVLVDGQTATLRGVVATERDRNLAEQLVRFEPGIWKVKNELVLAKPVDQVPKWPAPDAESGDKADLGARTRSAPAAE